MNPLSLWLNGGLILGWGLSLALAMGLDLDQVPFWLMLLVVLVRTQLQTGLFIVGHDAMHGLLFPGHPRCNQALGALTLMLYAGLAYEACRRHHHRHHREPASPHDPDVPVGLRGGPIPWYRHFLGRYLSGWQMTRLLSAWVALVVITIAVTAAPLAEAICRVLLCATLPLLLSSLQLFVFGTYLPHRGQRAPVRCAHPISLNLPPWLSLLACYHFGYHREHHDNPWLRWHELPAARTAGRAPVASTAAVSG